MYRMHLHISVPDLAQSVSFYEALFGVAPDVLKDDYAKWMLDDPRVNLAISQRGRAVGLDHVGIQADSAEGLRVLAGRLGAAGAETFDQQATSCCYAVSDKTWVSDPAGVRWETFHSFGDSTTYGVDAGGTAATADDTPCCGGAARPDDAVACC